MKHKNGHQYTGGSHGHGGGGADGSLKPVWDIVSDLAQALAAAKDQLSSLLHTRGSSNLPLKRANHGYHSPRGQTGTNSTTECVSTHGGLSPPRSNIPRCYSAPHARNKGGDGHGHGSDHAHGHPQNIHRSHARGFFAFGRNSEFKEQMHRGRTQERQYWETSGGHGHWHGGPGQVKAQEGPKYGINLEGRNGIFGIKVIPHGKSYTCKRDRDPDRRGLHMVAKMKNCHMNVDTDGEKFGPGSPVKIHFSTPSKVRIPTPFQHPAEVKRYCVGTQYANLLREEAHHLREKRIAEQGKIFKGDWKHA